MHTRDGEGADVVDVVANNRFGIWHPGTRAPGLLLYVGRRASAADASAASAVRRTSAADAPAANAARRTSADITLRTLPIAVTAVFTVPLETVFLETR